MAHNAVLPPVLAEQQWADQAGDAAGTMGWGGKGNVQRTWWVCFSACIALNDFCV